MNGHKMNHGNLQFDIRKNGIVKKGKKVRES